MNCRKRTESSKEIKSRGKFTTPNKCMKSSAKKFHESGKGNSRRENSPSKCSDQSPSSQLQRPLNTKYKGQEVPVLDLHSVQLSRKIKLQLFPLDAHTREGLEKDGFHPYLELILNSRKKVCSVLQRIHSKWGSSVIARGDPTLYPFDKSLLASSHKWTASSNITISDVYVVVGAPSIFRLRYGWSSETYSKTDKPPSSSTPGITCVPNEEPQNVTNNKKESANFLGKQMFGSSSQETDPPVSENTPPDGQENKTKDGSIPTLFSWDDGLSIGGLLAEVSLKGIFGDHSKNPTLGNANPTLWVDNLTNISMGGLFSEASLQGKHGINREQESTHNNDQPSVKIGGLLSEASSLGEGRFREVDKTWETRGSISQQSLPLISDSLHAFLVNQTDQPRAPCPEMSHSSILDSEDTCHAFSFRKRTTSQKVLEQVSEEADEQQQQKVELKSAKELFGSMGFNQDSSLGLSGIKWAESQGTFDLSISSLSRKLTNVDSASFGAVVKDLQEMDSNKEIQ